MADRCGDRPGSAQTSLPHNQLFGYAEPVGGSREHILPEDRAAFDRHLAQVFETGVFDLKVGVRRADGSVRWLHDWGRVLYAKGKPQYIAGVTLDITERKQAQARAERATAWLRLMMESVGDYAIFTVDEAQRITSWNVGAARLFGYREDEALGQLSDLIFTPEDRAAGVPEAEAARARWAAAKGYVSKLLDKLEVKNRAAMITNPYWGQAARPA